MSRILLEIKDLQTGYDTPAGPIPLVDGVSLQVRSGEIAGIVGGSGVGKSLLIASVLRLVKPPGRVFAGEILFKGQDLLKLTEKELNKIRGREFSYIAANPHTLLNPLISVGEQVVRFVRAHQRLSKKEATEAVIRMFKAVGLPDPEQRLHNYPHELSGGMAQRVVISVGLINSPQLVFADEPTFGLDVTIQAQVLELMKDLLVQNPQHAMLLVTRDLGVVANYCDSVNVMHDGRIIESATTQEFFAGPVTNYGQLLLDAAALCVADEIGGSVSRSLQGG